jgi:hypothetical protein
MSLPSQLDHLTDRRIRDFAAYWLGKRRGRLTPTRRDIDPIEIPWALPFVWLCDYLPESQELRYRLAGDAITTAYRRGLRGLSMKELAAPSANRVIVERYVPVVEMPAIVYNKGLVYLHSRRPYAGERVALPLSSTGESVDMIIGLTVSTPATAPDEPVSMNMALPNVFTPLSELPADADAAASAQT